MTALGNSGLEATGLCVSDVVVVVCVLQLFRALRGRIHPLSQMGQDLQAHDRKWLE